MPKKSEKTPSTGAENKTTEKKTVKKPASEAAENATPKKRGTPSQYANRVKPYLNDIERYVRCGVTEGQICAYYGVGRAQWAQYKKDNPELAETLLRAKQALKVDLVNKAFEVAMGYEYTEEKTETYFDKKGNVKGKKHIVKKCHAKADAGMIQFLLINRFSDEFARDPQTIELRKKALELAEQGKLPLDGSEGTV